MKLAGFPNRKQRKRRASDHGRRDGGDKRSFATVRRIGVVGFLFFLIKGLVWIGVLYFGSRALT